MVYYHASSCLLLSYKSHFFVSVTLYSGDKLAVLNVIIGICGVLGWINAVILERFLHAS